MISKHQLAELQREVRILTEELEEIKESAKYHVHIKALEKILYLESHIKTVEEKNELLLQKLKQYQILVGDISLEEFEAVEK